MKNCPALGFVNGSGEFEFLSRSVEVGKDTGFLGWTGGNQFALVAHAVSSWAIRDTAKSNLSFEISAPMNRLPFLLAATATVPVPVNGSTTRSPGWVSVSY